MSNLYQPGDHLVIDRGLYTHHGLYVGDDQVIHYAGYSLGSKLQDSSVQATSVANFAQGKAIIRRVHHRALYSREEAVKRARSRLGEDAYSLLFNNCEHFVNWCLEGQERSEQIERAKKAAMTVGATHASIKVAQQAARQSLQASAASAALSGSGAGAAATGLTGLGASTTGLSSVIGTASGVGSLAGPVGWALGASVGLVGYGLYRLFSD